VPTPSLAKFAALFSAVVVNACVFSLELDAHNRETSREVAAISELGPGDWVAVRKAIMV
jgi:hypothetical protein